MGKHSSYSKEFKDSIVMKIINRRNQTIAEVCEAEGIGQSTAANWLRNATMPAMKKKNRSKKWSAKQKLKAVSETLSANEAELGTYLRKEGLHSQELNEWQEQALASLDSSTKPSPPGQSSRGSRRRIDALSVRFSERIRLSLKHPHCSSFKKKLH